MNTDIRLAGAVWKKSSRSNGNGGNNCVQVAVLEYEVAVRDSKHPDGPVLLFTHPEWTAFLGGVTGGEFTIEQ
ncbi:DUF397 domain-containing protein [Winogradskya humida]|nr:DUF397 domain-containing protein [Actinoplanes humidus]